MSWLEQYARDTQEAQRLAIAAQVLPAIMAEGLRVTHGLRVSPESHFEDWAKLALLQADALLMAHATTPIKV